jgi:hypothetical protein
VRLPVSSPRRCGPGSPRCRGCSPPGSGRIVHGYWSIDLEILHTTAVDVLPSFVEQLRGVLAIVEAEAG